MGSRLWTPADLGSKLYIRFNSGTLSLSDNTPIDSWTGSGAEIVTVIAGGTERPTFRTGGDNGLPYAFFDGTNDYMQATLDNAILRFHYDEGITFLGSISRDPSDSSPNNRRTIFGTGNDGRHKQLELGGGGGGAGAVATIVPGVFTAWINTPTLNDRILALYRASNALGGAFGEINGSSLSASFAPTGAPDTSPGTWTFMLGTRNPTQQHFFGQIYDVCWIRGEATLDERQKYAGWAAWSRGRQADLPVDHPYKLSPPTVFVYSKSADQNNKKEGVDMPIYKGAAWRHGWLSETSTGAINSTVKPVVKIKQNSGAAVTIDPSRVINGGDGEWYVDFSAFEMAFDYISIIATEATLATYFHRIKTDDATASIFTMAVDFTNIVRPHILTILGAVVVSGRTVIDRLGSMTGSGINTIYGFLLAMVNKTATKPTDMGGTFDPATDSLEALRDRGDAAWTGGGGGGSMNYALKLVTGSVTETLQFNQQFPFGASGQTRIIDVQRGSVLVYPTAALASASEGGILQGLGEQQYQLTAEAILVAQENNTIVTISGNVA